MKSKLISEILCANIVKREVVAHDTHERQNTWFRSFSFDSSDYSLLYGFYICSARTLTLIPTHSNKLYRWYEQHTLHTHVKRKHIRTIARVHTTHNTHSHSDRRGKNKPFFVNICIRLNYFWYVSMCVCFPIEVMAMNKDRTKKSQRKLKWTLITIINCEKIMYRLTNAHFLTRNDNKSTRLNVFFLVKNICLWWSSKIINLPQHKTFICVWNTPFYEHDCIFSLHLFIFTLISMTFYYMQKRLWHFCHSTKANHTPIVSDFWRRKKSFNVHLKWIMIEAAHE